MFSVGIKQNPISCFHQSYLEMTSADENDGSRQPVMIDSSLQAQHYTHMMIGNHCMYVVCITESNLIENAVNWT